MNPDDIARAAGKAMYATDRAARSLGIHVLDMGAGWSRLQMAVRGHMVNGHDIGHGGLTFMLADTALAYASNSYNQRAVASVTQISFLHPTHAGDILTASATEVAVTGRTGVYDVDIRNQHDRTIAAFRGQTRTIKGRLVEDLPTGREMKS